jgi:hypothetical protein
MNKNLKRAIYKKRMSYNKYNRCKNKQNWEIYRKQRNLVNKIKKQSIRNYFIERCAGGPKSKHFWPTIKPFLTNKGSHFAKDIILCENDNIINNQTEVAETFNNFFINVAKDIGSQNIKTDDNHPSIKCLLITEINSDSKFSYAEFTLSHLSTIEFKFFCSKSFKKKFLVEVFKAPIFYKLFIYSRNCSFDLNRYNVMNVAQATIKVLYILTES